MPVENKFRTLYTSAMCLHTSAPVKPVAPQTTMLNFLPLFDLPSTALSLSALTSFCCSLEGFSLEDFSLAVRSLLDDFLAMFVFVDTEVTQTADAAVLGASQPTSVLYKL